MDHTEEQAEKLPVVTKITVQKKRKDRFNVFIDGEYSFPISEAVLIKVGLHKGMTLTKERSAEIEKENYDYMAYTTAVNYLSYSLRSEKEVRKKLHDEEISPDAIERALTRLVDQNYVNDRSYRDSYTRTAANLNLKGPQLIANELKGKGLSEEDIAFSLKQYPHELQLENAQTIAEKQLRKQSRVSSRMKRRRKSASIFIRKAILPISSWKSWGRSKRKKRKMTKWPHCACRGTSFGAVMSVKRKAVSCSKK